MIIELNIKNLAIMENIIINFTDGFNVLTGETGTGKSIIVEGLNMILGDRANSNMVKTGCEKATVEGLFSINNRKDIQERLVDFGIELDEFNHMLITRDIYSSGRSISRVNGRVVTLGMLNEITKKLVDIHSQQEHQALLNINNHMKLIDSFSHREVVEPLNNIKLIYSSFKEKERELEKYSIDEIERDRNLDLYEYQLNELNEIKLDEIDEEKIFIEYNKISNVKNIQESISKIDSLYKGDMYSTEGILDSIRFSIKELNKISQYDEKIEGYYKELENSFFEIEELINEISNYGGNISVDEESYFTMEKNIEFIEDLKRKYGPSLEDVKDYKVKLEEEIYALKNNERERLRVEKEIEELKDKLDTESERLSQIRKANSLILKDLISDKLHELNMENVRFEIDISRKDSYSEKGFDNVEFMIATNLGEDLKPLSQVVSGGEMSRIMLAFKTVFAEYDKIETMIFDEIDTGISGRTAGLVGKKISELSTNHQVICISHLPQIVSMADSHFLIEK